MAGDLTGAEKAAILLLAMGEVPAVEVMKTLDPKDIRIIGQEMGGIASVASEDHSLVMSEFTKLASHLRVICRGENVFDQSPQ